MSLFNTHLEKEQILSIIESSHPRFTLLGIGGVSMSSIARILVARGIEVVGYDLAPSPVTTELASSGIPITYDPCDSLLTSTNAIVYSLAIPKTHPAVIRAAEQGIPLISRANLLGVLTLDYSTRITVAGTHGKSTTTALISHILSLASVDHTAICGAPLSCGSPLLLGSRPATVVLEACEYKDSLLCLYPTVGVLTSVELDHTDYFPDLSAVRSSFARYLSACRVCVVSADIPGLDSIRPHHIPSVTFGFSQHSDYCCSDIRVFDTGTAFSVKNRGKTYTASIPMLGAHNCLNATCAIATCALLGISPQISISAISTFSGVHRRLTCLSSNPVPLFYDYAHHPTEISFAISAVKALYSPVTVVFRPHTYTRTRDLLRDLATALRLGDHTLILPVYPARESPIPGIDNFALAKAVGSSASAVDFSSADSAIEQVKEGALLLLGAGDLSPLAVLRTLKVV